MALNLSNLSILVVEDNGPLRELITSILKTVGVRKIHAASDGIEAFRIFCEENHDIIITDWEMPRMNGIELIRKIRTDKESPNRMVAVIMLTGYSAMSRIGEFRDAGGTEFLAKPFTAETLMNRITYVINKPRNFIETDDFFGPDRRRRVDPSFKGPMKREDDQKDVYDVSAG